MKLNLIVALLGLLAFQSARAELLRILHTNDLHGQLLGSQANSPMGGYAELKFMLDKMTQESEREGIPVVRLDAGDFSEGSLAYKANNGLDVFQIMEMMGYDAVSLGNHDYLMGANRLNEILGQTNLALVASNLVIHPDFKNIQQKILPYRLLKKGAFNISVIGGTNGDIFYKWVVKGDIKFKNAQKNINKFARKLEDVSDLNIALSHTGLRGDKKIAATSRFIDLIVGGHNHIKINEPIFVRNRLGRRIPIFQLGEHGHYLGEILIDIDRTQPHGRRAKIISYKVHPVVAGGQRDEVILAKINETFKSLDQFYGANYLHDILMTTNIPMENSFSTPTFWTSFFTDAIREEVSADLALNSSTFFGPSQSAGEVTRQKLMNFFPHFFNLQQREGWTIYTAELEGQLIKVLIDLSFTAGYPFLVSGVTFDIKTNRSGKKIVTNYRIAGKPIKNLKMYKVALPEGYVLGLYNSIPLVAKQILKDASDTNISIWSAVSHKIESSRELMVMRP
jgi:2',3'-cyclic-nucleotide 2'-phosphodiesterase (5'-nucleotidase family)